MIDDTLPLQRFGGRLWSAPAYLPYIQPPLTDEAVASAESQLGVKLPALYLALLRQQNSGYLRGSYEVSRRLNGIGPRFPSLSKDEAWWRPRHATSDVWIPAGSEQLIPFDGDGHWDMCFDYRQSGVTGEPSVTYVDCECEREEPVAKTFAAYLGSLEDSLADNVRLYGELAPAEVIRLFATKFGAPEPTCDTFSHGYEQWRIRLPGVTQWLWCSSNLVPAGFERVNDQIVTTETTALQLPEDPACSILVAVTDESRGDCLSAIAELGLDARSR